MPSPKTFGTFVQLLRERAQADDAREAFTFLRDGEQPVETLTYGDLDRQARAVAARLSDAGARPGDRALLLFPPGLAFISAFFGCLFAGIVPVPSYPPRPRRDDERLMLVAADAGARFVLTSSTLGAATDAAVDRLAAAAGISRLVTDAIPAELAASWQEPALDATVPAFLQYTSGSTGRPRGVRVSHANLLHNQAMLRDAFGTSPSTRVVSWLPLYHDMGLIGAVLHPVFVGGRCVLMSPVSFLQRPVRWLEAVTRYRATVSGAPDFAYDLCARRIQEEERTALDLSSWDVAFNGAEPVRAETLARFADAFASRGLRRESLYPCYGLAEATLFVSGGDRRGARVEWFDADALEAGRVTQARRGTSARRRALVSCGQPWHDQQVAIVDPSTGGRAQPDATGEIWIRGGSVCDGYWNRTDENAGLFAATLADDDHGPFLRTGDLGFVHGGELFITGRLKDLVIIRGRNHAPQDLELTVGQSHALLESGSGAAFSVERDDAERLVIVHEVTRRLGADVHALFDAIRRDLARAHALQPDAIVLIPQGTLPRTSSGKVRRAACRDAYLAGRLEAVAAWHATTAEAPDAGSTQATLDTDTSVLNWLRQQFAHRLGVTAATLDPDVPLMRFGLDSVSAVELSHALAGRFHQDVPPAWLLDDATLSDVARLCERNGTVVADLDGASTVDTAHDVDVQALTPGERALYFLQESAPDDSAYHIAATLAVQSPLNVEALRGALSALADRHPALRSSFAFRDGEPVRIVAPISPLNAEGDRPSQQPTLLTVINLGDANEDAVREQLARNVRAPFDLARGPLWRFHLFERTAAAPLLQLVVHHIVADQWSLHLIVEELGELYAAAVAGRLDALTKAGPELGGDRVQRVQPLEADQAARLQSFWDGYLREAPVVLDLPVDHPRPPVRAGRAGLARLTLAPDLSRAIRALATAHDTTVPIVLLTAYQVVLSRYARQRDLLVGVPVSSRLSDAARLVGYCVNTLPIRADLANDPPFATLLDRTRQAMRQLLAHAEQPFDQLVSRFDPTRDPGRPPLVQALFVAQQSIGRPELAALALGEPDVPISLGPLQATTVESAPFATPFDVTLRAAEWHGALHLALEYDATLFEGETADRMLRAIETLLDAAIESPGEERGRTSALTHVPLPVSTLPLLPALERQRILSAWNDTAHPIDAEDSVVDALARHARLSPDAPALACEGDRRTYAEMHRLTSRLAQRLRRAGVGPEVRVGVLMERSCELVEAVFGIVKAGGVYVPLDPSYPADRLAYMVEDARIGLVVTQRALAHLASTLGAETIVWESAAPPHATEIDEPPRVPVHAENLAYIIYTSGSTGRPKGAMNTHAGLKNRIVWMRDAYHVGPADCVLQKTPISFDVSIWELFLAPLAGARLLLARPDGHQDPEYLATVMAREGVTMVHFVPSMLDAFLRDAPRQPGTALRHVICSGEALTPSLQERFFERFPRDVELHNLYGPTEAAVDVTAWRCHRDDARRSVPIGRPIDNTAMYVLDRHHQPVPVGVPGDLFIGGMNLARGYSDRADLTADRFIPSPFGPSGARLYRTGDLARYRSDGVLEFLGRTDHQVKIRGARVELGEIDAALRRHPAVRDAVVVTHAGSAADRASSNYQVTERPQGGGATISRFFLKGGTADAHKPPAAEHAPADRLIAYIVMNSDATVPDASAWRAFLRPWLTDAMMPHAFVPLAELPRLPNGKLDRRALPAPPRERPRVGATYRPPSTGLESVLTDIWATVLGVDRVGAEDDFFELGGDSLRSLQVRALAQQRGLEVTLAQLFSHRTPAALARDVDAQRVAVATPEPSGSPLPFSLISDADRRRLPADAEDAYPLSRVQAGIIYHLQLQPESPVYHDIFVYRIRARFDERALRAAVQHVIDRHPILRSSFDLARFEAPVQIVHRRIDAPLSLQDWRTLGTEEQAATEAAWIETERRRRVDLTAPSQMRVVVQRMSDDVFQIVLSFFDMILDGWSTARLMTELVSGYVSHLRGATPAVEPLLVRYSDFVAAEREAIASPEWRAFWDDVLAGVEVTRLPRVKKPETAGGNALREVPIDAALSDGLWRAARLARVPLKHVLLAAHVRVLSVLSGQAEVLTGLEANGRVERPGSDRCLGTHINTIPLRCEIGDQTWVTLAQQLFERERTLLPARRYPLFDLQKQYGREPLLGTAFNFTHFHVFEELAGLPEIEILGAWGFEETNFTLRAEFNTNPFTGRVQLDLMAHLGELLPSQIDAIAGYYERALQAIAADPAARVRETTLVGAVERRQLLTAFNDTPPASAPAETLHAWIARQARFTPDAIAVEDGEELVRYRDLVRRANHVARQLQTVGVRPDDVVGLCAERSIDMVVAVLGILTASAACLPLDPAYPAERLAFMASDSRARVILAHAHLADRFTDVASAAVLDLGAIAAPTSSPSEREAAWTPPAVHGDNLAYVIYTSGSTGMPKGVAMPHAPLVTLVAWQLTHSTGATPARTLQFSPLSFDASFQEMLSTWVSGGTLVLIADAARRDPLVLLRHLQDRRIERLFCPFVALKQLAETVIQQRLAPEALRHVLTAGEALEVTPALASFFDEMVPPARLHNYYGPSETHVVTAFPLTGAAAEWPVLPPIGGPISGTQVYVLDDDLQPAPLGTPGELYIGGASLARGYAGHPDATADRFMPNPHANVPGSRLYRTGDLARWRPDGVLEFLGRADRQVKIRGFRVEPGEIENVLHTHPAVRQAVVVSRRDERGHGRLIAYVQPHDLSEGLPLDGPMPAALREFLKARLPDYMVPAIFMPIAALPMTPSGKLDRRALPEPLPPRGEARRGYTAPRTPLEELVAGLFAEVLGIGDVGREEEFFELGGDSLLATQVVSRLSIVIGREIPLRTLFEASTAAALASAIATENPAGAVPPVRPRPAGEAAPLSFAQQRMVVASYAGAQARAYANPALIDVRGPLDVNRLEQALRLVVQRHEALRTVFRFERGEPSAQVREEALLEFRVVVAPGAGEQDGEADTERFDAQIARCVRDEIERPFDLTRGPLLRVIVMRSSDDGDRHVVLATLHHIVSDGWSMGVLLREITAFYRALADGPDTTAESLPLQYGDFASWQRASISGDVRERLAAYWTDALRDVPTLELPTDHPRPLASTFHGARVPFAIGHDVTSRLKRLGRREGATLFMTLLAGCHLLLGHESGAEDFAVGTDVAQRNRPELEPLIGFFVNQLVLRADLSGDPTFRLLLARVRATALEAYAHQDLPFDQLVDLLNPVRAANRTPLFQVKFVLQNAPAPAVELDGLTMRFLPHDPGTAKFDLLVNVWEQDGALSGYFEYATDLFDDARITRLARQYAALLSAVSLDAELTASALFGRLDALAADERARSVEQRRHDQRARLASLTQGQRQRHAHAPHEPDAV